MSSKQIFLLPFAGGNCYSYRSLTNYISKDYDIFTLELPGRGKRTSEDLIRNREAAIRDYLYQIMRLRNGKPYLIFGHSMGAIMAFYLTLQLESRFDAPRRIIVTGSAGPGIASYKKEYLSSDNEFKEVLRSFGGMPEEVLSDDSLFNFFNPILRSDFQILEEFDLPNEYIKTDVLAIMGNNEKHASFIENWKKFSFGKVLVNHLEGGHFFINQHLNEIALEINHS